VKFLSKKTNGHKVSKIDAVRSNKLSRSFDALSNSKRRQELAKAGNEPVKRPFKLTIKKTVRPALVLTEGDSEVNVSGNKRGMHLKGSSEKMRALRAMRRIYRNKQLPVLQCSSCAYAQQCPSFKAGYECAYLPFLNSHNIDSEADTIFYLREMITAKIRRDQLGTIMETMSGAAPSLELSESMQMTIESLFKLHERMQETSESEISVEGDKSIIGHLFGNVENLLSDTKSAQLEYNETVPVPSAKKEIGDVIDIEVETIPNVRPQKVNQELMNEFEKNELDEFVPAKQELVVSELKA
jgi:hypothetical protein